MKENFDVKMIRFLRIDFYILHYAITENGEVREASCPGPRRAGVFRPRQHSRHSARRLRFTIFFSSSLAIESGKYNARDEIRNGEEAFIATGKVRFTMASASAGKVMTQVFFRPLFTKFASFHLRF